MNNKLIEEIIKSNNVTCPELTYTKGLIDKNVARALSKSFIEMLKLKKTQNGTNKTVTNFVLQSIRDACKTAPEDHIEIDEDLTEVLTSIYGKRIKNTSVSVIDIDKKIDAFLVRKSKVINLNSQFHSNNNPEVLQAMLNLSDNVELTDIISKDLLYWNINDNKSKTFLHNLWNEEKEHDIYFYDNISFKMKHNIETILLEISYKLLDNSSDDIHSILTSEFELKSLINISAKSAECFQICICILNTLFIATSFNSAIQTFICYFIQNVKLHTQTTISVLYPTNLTNLVIMLDISLDELPPCLKDNYIKFTKKYLNNISNNSKNDLIMLLSHFPLWFHICFYE